MISTEIIPFSETSIVFRIIALLPCFGYLSFEEVYEGWTQTIRTPLLHQTMRTPMLLDDWLSERGMLVATFSRLFVKNHFTCGVQFLSF